LPWSCAFRSTFRLYPDGSGATDLLDVFLASDGKTQEEVLAALPYHKARSAAPGALPNAKRYRDGRQLLRTVGLVYDIPEAGTHRLQVTALGKAVARWRPVINERNAPVLGRHAAQALAACQLRNPTREGREYPSSHEVFPFSFIWRAMLELDDVISSDELNRAILKVSNEDELLAAIDKIRQSRTDNDLGILGEEVISEQAKNDRILIWVAWASFGWTLIQNKPTQGGVYAIAPNARRVVEDAAAIRHKHREFSTEKDYIEHVASCAGLPEDLR
jgi:hypothetical protein